MKRRKIAIVTASMILAANLCVGCGNTKNIQDNVSQGETDIRDAENDVSQEEMDMHDTDIGNNEDVEGENGFSETVIYTEYIPVDYRKNALIVQKSEDMELYGLLDDNGNIILEPKYDSLNLNSRGDYI